MKKFIIILITLCATITVFAQSIKSIRINGQDQQQYVAISQIDSITYDVGSQLQILWSKNNKTPISISDIESISFENNEVTYSYLENIVDSIDAVFTEDGYVALFGVQKAQDSDNISEIYNRFVTICKIDYETGIIDESKKVSILVDSLNNPSIIAMDDYTYFISNITENTFDCIIMSGDDTWEYKSIPYSYTHSSAKCRMVQATRANGDIASSPTPPFGFNNLTDCIGMGNALGTAITATTNGERISAGLGIVGSFAGLFNGEAGLLLSGLSDAVVKSLGGSALAVAGYLWDRNYKFILKHIGPWYVGIQSVEPSGRRACKIQYNISGINANPEGHPKLKLLCQNQKTKKYQTVEMGDANNGHHTFELENLEPGKYNIEIRMYDDCHRAMNICVMTYPAIEVDVYDLGLDRYEVEEDPAYINGCVNFKMKVYLKGSDEGLGDIQQFGYYTRYSNAYPDYKEVSHLSTIFESTPLTYDLPIEKEGFFEENKDYNAFEATAKEYYIGVYLVLKNGNIVTYDEQEIEGLVYKQKPSLTFTSASLGGTETYTDENGEPYYCATEINATYIAKGTFWVNTTDLVVIQGTATDNVGYWETLNDGESPFSVYYQYPYGGDNLSAFKFDMVISEDNRISSTNAIQVSGSPYVTNIAIINNSLEAKAVQTNTQKKPIGDNSHKARYVLRLKKD